MLARMDMESDGIVHVKDVLRTKFGVMNTSIATDPRRTAHFNPAETSRPKALTKAEVELYNSRVIIGPFTVQTEDETARNRQAFDEMLATFTAMGKDSYAINGFHDRCATIWDMATNPRILDRVEDLIGPDIVVWATHFFCKIPGDGKTVRWHQDATYWPLTPTKTVTAWIAIDGSDQGNGGMQYLPGSHLHGALPVRPSPPEANNVLHEEASEWERFGEPEHISLQPGQCTFHADLLLHGSQPNTSTRRRCGLTVRYAAASVRAWKEGWNANAIICRGHDEGNHWIHRARPDGNHPFGPPNMIGSN